MSGIDGSLSVNFGFFSGFSGILASSCLVGGIDIEGGFGARAVRSSSFVMALSVGFWLGFWLVTLGVWFLDSSELTE